MRNEGNYLLGLNKPNWPGGDIRPGLEAGSLVGGRITPAVAVVGGAQELVFIQQTHVFVMVFEWGFTNR